MGTQLGRVMNKTPETEGIPRKIQERIDAGETAIPMRDLREALPKSERRLDRRGKGLNGERQRLLHRAPRLDRRERTCDDTHDKPYLNKKPITNAQIISVPQTVGFSDGSGKTYKKTNYSFTIKRDDRFEAGEYQLEVQQDGKAVGSEKLRQEGSAQELKGEAQKVSGSVKGAMGNKF